jgi:hypothetical protein
MQVIKPSATPVSIASGANEADLAQPPGHRGLGAPGSRGTAPHDAVTPIISCYDNAVPDFVAAELDRLYQHINSSLSHFDMARLARGASTYIVRRADRIETILLFIREHRKIIVLNQMIPVSDEEITLFANYIFGKDESVFSISFHLIRKAPRSLPYPSQEFNSSEDVVLTLPATPDAYLASLSSKMRRNIRYYLRNIARDFPTFRYQVYEKEEITEQQVRAIIELNRARIDGKQLRYCIRQDELDWIVSVVKSRGLVGVATIDGKICGGAVNLRVGDHYFGHTIAHDTRYNSYSLGILCAYLTICANIERGAKETHFSWGRYEYKYKLLGVQRDMAGLTVYRSALAYWLAAPTLLSNATKDYVERTKRRALEAEQEDGAGSGRVSGLLRLARTLKRSITKQG